MAFLAVVVVNYMVSGTLNNNYKASCSSGYIKEKKNKINHSQKNGLSDRFCCAESGREGATLLFLSCVTTGRMRVPRRI